MLRRCVLAVEFLKRIGHCGDLGFAGSNILQESIVDGDSCARVKRVELSHQAALLIAAPLLLSRGRATATFSDVLLELGR